MRFQELESSFFCLAFGIILLRSTFMFFERKSFFFFLGPKIFVAGTGSLVSGMSMRSVIQVKFVNLNPVSSNLL